MVIDKTTLIFVPVMAIIIFMAAILSMGAIPEIFRQGEQLDQALIQQHEDAARANQTLHEDQARDLQVVKISNHMDNQLDKMQDNLTQFMADSEKRSNVSIAQRANMMSNISVVVNSLENKSKDHAIFSKNMSDLQNNISNLSLQIRDMLHDYGENSVEKLQSIVDTQRFIVETHKKILDAIHDDDNNNNSTSSR